MNVISKYEKLLKFVDFRDIKTSEFSCLTAFLCLCGRKIDLDTILSIAPISSSGASEKELRYVAKRTGIFIEKIEQSCVKKFLAKQPILFRRTSGYSLILLKLTRKGFLAYLPGYNPCLKEIPFDSDLFEEFECAYAIRKIDFAPSLKKLKPVRKTWLIQWKDHFNAVYDFEAVNKQRESLRLVKRKYLTPIAIKEISIDSLLLSHQSICPDFPEFYGVFRKINLRRNSSVFVDFRAVQSALDDLLYALLHIDIKTFNGAISLAVLFFTDFQTIHPFLNGNRRAGQIILSKYLSKWGKDIQWEKISSSQFHFWTRCACRGHFRFLEDGFRRHVIDLTSP